MSDSGYLDKVLEEGARNAADIADATLHNVYQAMGFLRRHWWMRLSKDKLKDWWDGYLI